MKSNRPSVARICLALSWLFSAFGLFMLCECPGFYVLSALLALGTIFAGDRRMKLWGAIALGVALGVLPSQIHREGSAKEKAKKVRELHRQKVEALERVATNGPAQ